MAESAINAEEIILFDHFPGIPVTTAVIKDSFDSSEAGFNVSNAAWRAGTKVQVWDETAGGPVVMMYAQNADLGTGPLDATVAGTILGPHTNFYTLSTDPDDDTDFGYTSGMAAIAIGAVTKGNYAWFWVGGVCPQNSKVVSSSMAAVNLLTEDTVAANSPVMLNDSDAAISLILGTGDVNFCAWSRTADD